MFLLKVYLKFFSLTPSLFADQDFLAKLKFCSLKMFHLLIFCKLLFSRILNFRLLKELFFEKKQNASFPECFAFSFKKLPLLKKLTSSVYKLIIIQIFYQTMLTGLNNRKILSQIFCCSEKTCQLQ